MESKIRLKVGAVEVEYEGSEEFIRNELLGLFSELAKLGKQFQFAQQPQQDLEQEPTKPDSSKGGKINLSVGTIAARLGAKSGSDLITAAATYLTFVGGHAQFTRAQLRDAMKSASAYYKNSYAKNLTTYLQSLVKDETLNEVSKGRYALKAGKRGEMERTLAD